MFELTEEQSVLKDAAAEAAAAILGATLKEDCLLYTSDAADE